MEQGERIELRVANNHVRIPLSEYEKLAAWQTAWIERAKRVDQALLVCLHLIRRQRESDAALSIRFLNDENAHLWEIAQELLGDVEYLRAGLRSVLASETLDEAKVVARKVLEESELVLVEDR